MLSRIVCRGPVVMRPYWRVLLVCGVGGGGRGAAGRPVAACADRHRRAEKVGSSRSFAGQVDATARPSASAVASGLPPAPVERRRRLGRPTPLTRRRPTSTSSPRATGSGRPVAAARCRPSSSGARPTAGTRGNGSLPLAQPPFAKRPDDRGRHRRHDHHVAWLERYRPGVSFSKSSDHGDTWSKPVRLPRCS